MKREQETQPLVTVQQGGFQSWNNIEKCESYTWKSVFGYRRKPPISKRKLNCELVNKHLVMTHYVFLLDNIIMALPLYCNVYWSISLTGKCLTCTGEVECKVLKWKHWQNNVFSDFKTNGLLETYRKQLKLKHPFITNGVKKGLKLVSTNPTSKRLKFVIQV